MAYNFHDLHLLSGFTPCLASKSPLFGFLCLCFGLKAHKIKGPKNMAWAKGRIFRDVNRGKHISEQWN